MEINHILPTPLRHAARAGLILGLYFVFKYFLLMYTPSMPVLGIIYLFATLAVPFVAYRLTASYRALFPERIGFPISIGWSHGVMLYAFASILVLPSHYYFYTSALPSQIPALEELMQQSYSQSPDMKPLLISLYGGEPIEMLRNWLSSLNVFSRLWSDFGTNVFWGSILSLVNALILRRKPQTAV